MHLYKSNITISYRQYKNTYFHNRGITTKYLPQGFSILEIPMNRPFRLKGSSDFFIPFPRFLFLLILFLPHFPSIFPYFFAVLSFLFSLSSSLFFPFCLFICSSVFYILFILVTSLLMLLVSLKLNTLLLLSFLISFIFTLTCSAVFNISFLTSFLFSLLSLQFNFNLV